MDIIMLSSLLEYCCLPSGGGHWDLVWFLSWKKFSLGVSICRSRGTCCGEERAEEKEWPPPFSLWMTVVMLSKLDQKFLNSVSPMRQMCRKGVCSAAGKAKRSCTVLKTFWKLRIRYLKLNIWRQWKLGIHQCVFSPVKCCDRCQILQRCCKYQSIACKALRCMAILENSCGKIRKSVFTTEILNFWSCRAVLPQRLLTCGFGLSAVVFF